jgi:hypothetical protein
VVVRRKLADLNNLEDPVPIDILDKMREWRGLCSPGYDGTIFDAADYIFWLLEQGRDVLYLPL